jgi:hypothetical protein
LTDAVSANLEIAARLVAGDDRSTLEVFHPIMQQPTEEKRREALASYIRTPTCWAENVIEQLTSYALRLNLILATPVGENGARFSSALVTDRTFAFAAIHYKSHDHFQLIVHGSEYRWPNLESVPTALRQRITTNWSNESQELLDDVVRDKNRIQSELDDERKINKELRKVPVEYATRLRAYEDEITRLKREIAGSIPPTIATIDAQTNLLRLTHLADQLRRQSHELRSSVVVAANA